MLVPVQIIGKKCTHGGFDAEFLAQLAAQAFFGRLARFLLAAGRQNANLLVVIFEQGIAVAQARGDVQAAKEMAVFRKRLHKPAS